MFFLTIVAAVFFVRSGSCGALSRDKRQVFFEEELPAADQCSYLNTLPGKCVPLIECGKLRVLVNSPTPNNLSILRRATCGFTGREPMVCCPFENVIIPTPGPPITPPPPPVRPPVQPPRLENRLPSVCGQSTTSQTRIVDGQPAPKGAWPWMALLGYRDQQSGSVDFNCGGSLITSRHVLTAAHCVFGKDDLQIVRVGEHDLQAASDPSRIDVKIIRKIVHENYDSSGKSWQNDIAILRLETEVPFSDEVSPVCLPISPQLRSQDYTRMNPFVAGWGTTEFPPSTIMAPVMGLFESYDAPDSCFYGDDWLEKATPTGFYYRIQEGKSSDILLQAQVTVQPQDTCKTAYSNFKSVVVDNRVLCAGARKGREDACQGDSGGPLMLPNGENYYQIGVVSFGFKCALKDFPGVYTRTASFADWILDKLV